MALCHNCDDARIEYIGDGSQTDYTFPFEYNERTDVTVAFWNEDLLAWEVQPDVDWDFLNDTTIRITEAPDNNQKLIIYRCTDLDPLPAVFHPGHSIKAQDLNDNFFVLNLAIEEARCAIQRQDEKAIGRYWNKVDSDLLGETVYSESEWVSSDDRVTTTKALDERFWDQEGETTYSYDSWQNENDDSHVPTTAAVEKRIQGIQNPQERRITKDEQITGQAESKIGDLNVFSSAASVARHDTYTQEDRPEALTFEQPGKLWYDTSTLETYTWDDNAGAWTLVSKTGQRGEQGEVGPQGPSGIVIVSDTRPLVHPNGGPDGGERPLVQGDQWFHSEKTQLYIYYKDDTGHQWVSVTAKGPPGEDGQAGADGVALDSLLATAPIVVTKDVDATTANYSIDLSLLTFA